jgi:hypothetical protein
MKFTILLKSEDDSSAPLIVSQIERTGVLVQRMFASTLAWKLTGRCLCKSAFLHH